MQANIDIQYEWQLLPEMGAFVGADVNYTDESNAYLGKPSDPEYNKFDIHSRTLLDLRVGVAKGAWRFSLWGRKRDECILLDQRAPHQ